MSEDIEFHGWLGKNKSAVFLPQVFFSGIALNAGQKYCRVHSAILSNCNKLHFPIKTFVLSIFSGHLRQVLLYWIEIVLFYHIFIGIKTLGNLNLNLVKRLMYKYSLFPQVQQESMYLVKTTSTLLNNTLHPDMEK